MKEIMLLFLKIFWSGFKVVFSMVSFYSAFLMARFLCVEVKEESNEDEIQKKMHNRTIFGVIFAIIALIIVGIGIWLIF